MSIAILLCLLSLAGLLIISIYRFVSSSSKNKYHFIIHLVTIFMYLFFICYFYIDFNAPVKRGKEENDIYFVIILYGFMVFGMLAQSAYSRFEKPKDQRPEFDIGLFIAPIFASPIVFLPLLASMQNAEIDLERLTTARIMVFFVAFENGFFWKDFFDNRQKLKKADHGGVHSQSVNNK